ncbi:MAG: bifunctional adenosylcobinamide kinase/adenosylcobinamide-phosphate guanylyltransferase [Pseudomonadota bacterium]
MRRITLVLGGARSGKSRHAEALAKASKQRVYVATAEIIDAEMRERIDLHRAQRGKGWRTLEVPLDLADALRGADRPGGFILVECITIWINNLIYHGKDVASEVKLLCGTLPKLKGRVVLVSNEVGLGIVPDNALARRFRDEAGRANQSLAAVADEVLFIAAGLPMVLKKPKPPARRRPSGSSKRARRG